MDTSHIDLLTLIGRDTPLKRIAGTNGGEYAGPCPLCGGKDRLKVQPQRPGGPRWFCRQCGKQGGSGPVWEDAIAYVVRHDGVKFRAACATLGLETGSYKRPVRTNYLRKAATRPNTALVREDWIALNDADWRANAARFVEQASACLAQQDQGQPGRDYLRKRGLCDARVLAMHSLGYNARPYRALWGAAEVYIPARSIIFSYHDLVRQGVNHEAAKGEVIKIKFRRIDLKQFGSAKGSANGLFGLTHLSPGKPAILVEAELCALSIWQAALGPITPLATGSSRWWKVAVVDNPAFSGLTNHSGFRC